MNWNENLCRLCGSINECTHSVFKIIKNESLHVRIKRCLNLDIYRDDYKPKKICEECMLKMNQFNNFIEICEITNQKFESMLESRSSWNEFDYDQSRSVIVSMKNGTDYVHNGFVDTELASIEPLNAVFQIVQHPETYPEGLNEIENSNCSTQYFGCDNTVQKNPVGADNLKTFYNGTELNQPTEKGVDYIDLDEKRLNSNYSNHNEMPLVSVEEVRKQIQENAPNISHNSGPKKTFKCPHCERVFKRRISLNSHMAIHTKSKPFSCGNCGKKFAIKSDLTVHEKIHSDLYRCKICSKSFTVPSKLNRHIRTHTKEKPFECKIEGCGKSFSDPSNLNEHENTHKIERELSCLKCEKKFKTHAQLKSHNLTHLDLKFTCDICKSSYKYKTNLKFHMKKHNGYNCSLCSLKCGKFSALIKHRKECKNRL